MLGRNMKKKFLKYKEQEKIVNVVDDDDDEEIYLQDDEHDDNMDLDWVDYTRWWMWWKEIIILAYFFTFELINLNVYVINIC